MMTQAELESELIALHNKIENMQARETKRNQHWHNVRKSARFAAGTYGLIAFAYFASKIVMNALQIQPMKPAPLDYLFASFGLTSVAINLLAMALRDPDTNTGWKWPDWPFG
jgi:hypothetical protein